MLTGHRAQDKNKPSTSPGDFHSLLPFNTRPRRAGAVTLTGSARAYSTCTADITALVVTAPSPPAQLHSPAERQDGGAGGIQSRAPPSRAPVRPVRAVPPAQAPAVAAEFPRARWHTRAPTVCHVVRAQLRNCLCMCAPLVTTYCTVVSIDTGHRAVFEESW